MTFPKAAFGSAVLLVAVSALYLLQTFTLQDSGVSASETSPMTYPLTIGVPMAILSVILLVSTSYRLRVGEPSSVAANSSPVGDISVESDPGQPAHDSPVFQVEAPIIFGLTVAHVALLPVWGYVIGTAVYTFACVLVIRGNYRPRWTSALITGVFSVGVSVATFAALRVGLGIPLPEGLIGLGGL